jgi:hypothetical protein
VGSSIRALASADTSNRFVVARGRDRVFLTVPTLETMARGISPDDAINLAAWLASMVDDGAARVAATMAKINT